MENNFHLMAAAGKARRKHQHPHFLEHQVIVAARLIGDSVTLPGYACRAGSPAFVTVPAGLLQIIGAHPVSVSRGPDVPGNSLPSVTAWLSFWHAQFDTPTEPRLWVAWTSLAVAIA